MQRRSRWLWVPGLALLVSCITLQAQSRTKLALVGGMLLHGYEVPPLHHAAILIEGNKIVQVGRAAEIAIPRDATVIDTSGRVMMPGLIDLHTHLMILGHGDYDGYWSFPWIWKNGIARVMEISARQLLMAGVTSAVDLGGPLQESLRTRDRINRAEIPGPRMWMAGPWITRRVARQKPKYGITITRPEEAAQATEDLIKAGVDVVKTHAALTLEDYKAVVSTAHKHNLKVHAFVWDPDDVRNALVSGVDVLQQVGTGGWDAMPYDPALVRAVVVKRTPVVITAVHRWIYSATVEFPERLQDPQLKKDFPPELYEEVQKSLENFPGLAFFQHADREIFFRDTLKYLTQWINAGAEMGMGTASGTPMNFHTEALWREIKAHVDMGMSPQRAISAATRIGARVLGRGNDLGTIEPGKLADIIVVEGNPLFNITALANVEVVIKDGVVYKGGPAASERKTARKPI